MLPFSAHVNYFNMNCAEEILKVTITNIMFRGTVEFCGPTAERSLFTVLFHVRHVVGFAGKNQASARGILVRNPKGNRQFNNRIFIYGHKFMTLCAGIVVTCAG
jgi:hypothetical protein